MYPTLFTTPGVSDFAQAVDAERQAQLKKFGDQRHPDGTGPDQQILPDWTAVDLANAARANCQRQAEMGIVTWRDIFGEEACEVLAETEWPKLRAELIQTASVIQAWISDGDRRAETTLPRPSDTDRVVAYRSAGGRALRCLQHRPSDDAFTNGDFHPVTSEDLPDGGICTFPVSGDERCSVDVLIPQEPKP
jgi:hypothetical protein